jgi:hypothetical protein
MRRIDSVCARHGGAADPPHGASFGARRKRSNRPIRVENGAVDFHGCQRPEFDCRRIDQNELAFTLRLGVDELILVDVVANNHLVPCLAEGQRA